MADAACAMHGRRARCDRVPVGIHFGDGDEGRLVRSRGQEMAYVSRGGKGNGWRGVVVSSREVASVGWHLPGERLSSTRSALARRAARPSAALSPCSGSGLVQVAVGAMRLAVGES